MAEAAVKFLLERVKQIVTYHVDIVRKAAYELKQLTDVINSLKNFLEDAERQQQKDSFFRQTEKQQKDSFFRQTEKHQKDSFFRQTEKQQKDSFFRQTEKLIRRFVYDAEDTINSCLNFDTCSREDHLVQDTRINLSRLGFFAGAAEGGEKKKCSL